MSYLSEVLVDVHAPINFKSCVLSYGGLYTLNRQDMQRYSSSRILDKVYLGTHTPYLNRSLFCQSEATQTEHKLRHTH